MTLDLYVTILLAVGFVANLGFFVSRVLTRWRSTEYGRFLMADAVSMTLVLGALLPFRLFGDYPGRRGVVALALTGVVLAQVWKLSLALRHRRDGKR